VRAIISVSDKTGVVQFAQGLSSLGIRIFSTGGTLRALALRVYARQFDALSAPTVDEVRAGAGREPRMLRALIVEDELLVAWHLEGLLEDLGHEVCAIAPSAAAALSSFRDFEPDLVLMDVNLGAGPGGVELAERLLNLRRVPLIFVTAYGDPDSRAAMAAAAPDSLVLSKPVSAADLGRGIEAVTGTRH